MLQAESLDILHENPVKLSLLFSYLGCVPGFKRIDIFRIGLFSKYINGYYIKPTSKLLLSFENFSKSLNFISDDFHKVLKDCNTRFVITVPDLASNAKEVRKSLPNIEV